MPYPQSWISLYKVVPIFHPRLVQSNKKVAKMFDSLKSTEWRGPKLELSSLWNLFTYVVRFGLRMYVGEDKQKLYGTTAFKE